jgi:hypothetical protein
MLSTAYRIKLEGICSKIAKGESVELSEMIWCEKLSAHNASAAKILRQARRRAENPDMVEGSMDDFLNQLDIGGLGHERFGKSGFNSVDEIVDWFKRDDLTGEDDTWRRRD